jgi:hypothetical protein
MAKLLSLMLLFATVAVAAQEVPAEIRGEWVVEQVLPTCTISCWGTKDASRIIGTEIRYTAHSLAWGGYFVAAPSVSQRAVTAEQFQRQNSGQGTNSSQVSFRTLDISVCQGEADSVGTPTGGDHGRNHRDSWR